MQTSDRGRLLQLAPLATSTAWLPEPDLAFAGGNTAKDPRVGIPLYGPKSLGTGRHKKEIHVGFIGTASSVDNAMRYMRACAAGVDGDAEHHPFPGMTSDSGFRTELRFDDKIVERITQTELRDLLEIRSARDGFERTVGLLGEKLKVLGRRDHPLDYVMLVLSPELYAKRKSVSYRENGQEQYRNLRRVFKAMAMAEKRATQILQETTTGLLQGGRKLDHASVIAWNLFSGMYFKVEGLPWGPVSLTPDSCHIGISFYRPSASNSTLRASVVQAFDENGDGLILRGQEFTWDERKDGRSPHLTEELAGELIQLVLKSYEAERGRAPQRVVVHKASRFDEAERKGFQQALRAVKYYDLVTIHPVSETRLLRAGTRPPLRGTSFTIGDHHYLYTTGYIPEIGRYPHGHVPSPLLITDHVGDTAPATLQQEILALTKMNWNSANIDGLMPITLRFSRLVGDILRELPPCQTPEPKYKYYM